MGYLAEGAVALLPVSPAERERAVGILTFAARTSGLAVQGYFGEGVRVSGASMQASSRYSKRPQRARQAGKSHDGRLTSRRCRIPRAARSACRLAASSCTGAWPDPRGCRAVAIASASSALCALADRLTACGNGYFHGLARVAPLSNIHRWGRRSAAGEHVAREAGGDRVGGEVRATGAGARGIVVVVVTRAMELREEEREAPTRAPDDGRVGRRFAHRVAV